MPGAGKTTLGRILANALNRPFLDTDEMIKQRTGMHIVDYWAEHGEFFFRSLERMQLMHTLGYAPSVIATGGGLPAFMDNMSIMEGHHVIFLDTRPPVLVKRLAGEDRPVFGGKKPEEQDIAALLDSRRPFYQRSAYTLRCEDVPEVCLNNLMAGYINKVHFI